MLCSRLRKILSDIVDQAQSAFVEKRVIMHNIFICLEMLNKYRSKNHPTRCTMKIDLRKAYDPVHWVLLKNSYRS